MKKKYTDWQVDEMWLGYLEEYPDYWTQGESEAELKENLLDFYTELTSGRQKHHRSPLNCEDFDRLLNQCHLKQHHSGFK